MKNRIISIIILISFLLLVYVMLKGIHVGNFEILSISQIKEKNNELNKGIEKANNLVAIEYPKNVDTLSETYDNYIITKEKYEQLAGLSGDDKIKMYETKQYDIGYLWKVLGDYAEIRNLTLGVEVQKSSNSNSLYSFNFSVSGEYQKVIKFIEDLENDSDLYFRIYDFKISGSGTTLNASFRVENININPATIKNIQNNSSEVFEEKE